MDIKEILLWVILGTQLLTAKWVLQLDYYIRFKKGNDNNEND